MEPRHRHIIHKNNKFGFHKTLKNGIGRWTCTKYKCNAYIKIHDGNIIFESLNHRQDANRNPNSLSIERMDIDAEPAKSTITHTALIKWQAVFQLLAN